MKKLTLKESYELNSLFETNKFKPGISRMNLYTSVLFINSRRISPGENNLRIIQSKEYIHKLKGKFIDKTRKILHLVGYSLNGDVVIELDFNCSELYQVKEGKQLNDICNNSVEFSKIDGEIFIPKSKYYGFKILYDK